MVVVPSSVAQAETSDARRVTTLLPFVHNFQTHFEMQRQVHHTPCRVRSVSLVGSRVLFLETFDLLLHKDIQLFAD